MILLWYYAENRHVCYVYTLGVYEANRRTVDCKHAESFSEKKVKDIPQWWTTTKKTSDKKKQATWPTEPEKFIYERIHTYREHAPWCTYVLTHEAPVAASSLGIEDLPRFPHNTVWNDELFVGCELTEGNKARMGPLQVKLTKQIKLYSRVVPYLDIQQKCEEVEKYIVEENTKFCQELQETVEEGNTTNITEVLSEVDKYMDKQRLHFFTMVQRIRGWRC